MNKRQRKKAKRKALLRLIEAKTTAAKEYFRSAFQDDLVKDIKERLTRHFDRQLSKQVMMEIAVYGYAHLLPMK